MPFKVSSTGLDFIKKQEGFVPNAYPDAKTGKTAIGYGDTLGDQSRPIDEAEANRRLVNHISEAERYLSSAVKRELPQHQQDVMGDMYYNMGPGNMAGFIDLVNSGADDNTIANEIKKYTKSRNAKTGQMEELEVLRKRSTERASMWLGTSASTPATNDDIMAAISTVKNGPGDDIVDAVNSIRNNNAESPNSPLVREQGLAIASEVADDEQAAIQQEARTLAGRLGISTDEALMRLAVKKPKEILADQKRSIIAENFPGTSTWAQDPHNYVLLKETENWAPRVEVAAKALNKKQKGDWAKALDQNRVMLHQSAVIGAMVLRGMSLEDGKKSLAALDIEARNNQITSPGAQALSKVFSSKTASTWDMLKAMANNPTAAAQMQLQSGGSTVATMGAGIVGGVAGTAVLPGVGTAIGAGAAAYSTSHVLSFGEHMLKQLEEFRDPVTGTIDYDRAFADPARVQKWTREADIYGFTMGAADAVFSIVGGKLGSGVVKHVFKAPAKTAAGKAARAGVNIGTQTAGKAVEEGGSQTAALTAVDLYKGTLTPEKWQENKQEGKVEALMSTGPGALMSGIGYGANKVATTKKQAAKKTVALVDEANKANEDVAALSNLRAKRDENEASRSNPDQTGDLIDNAVRPEIPADDPYAPPVDEVDELVPTEMKQIDDEADNDSVAISPSEWDKYHALKGEDANERLSTFSPSLQATFFQNRASDTSVVVPISEWLRATEDDPGLEAIVRINGNRLNALEANEIAEELEAEPFKLFESDDVPPGWDIVEPGPEQESDLRSDNEGITIIEATEAEGNIISRPVELITGFRTDGEKKILSSLISRLKQVTKNSPAVDQESMEIVAELEFRHLRHRAKMLGQTTEEVAERLKLGVTSDPNARGSFAYRGPTFPYTVAFNKTALAKTVIHEFGHSWLQEMSEDWGYINSIPEDDLTDAQREYKDAMILASDLLGMDNMGSLLTMEGARRTRVHETFAQTSEMYFLEGKFANSKVKALMESFRKWMVAIIEFVGASYPQYPPLKITPEVERMFEAILGVSERVEDEVIPMFPEPMFNPEMLGEDGKNYIERIRDARSQAIAEAYGKFFNKNLAARERAIDAEIDRIHGEAIDEVDQIPSMQVLAQFRKGYEDFKAGKTSDDPRLSYESVLRTLFNGDETQMRAFKESVPREMITGKKKGGMDVAMFMRASGISSPAAMRDMLVEMGTRDTLIEKLTNRKIDTEFPVMKSDEEIHQIAVDAVNARGKEALLLDEMKLLAKKYLPALRGSAAKLITPAEIQTRSSKEHLYGRALEIVRHTPAFKFSANKFLMDSARHGRQAARLFKSNNILEAFDSKYREAIHFYGYKVAREAQKEIADVRARIKQIVKYSRSKDALKKYDADVMRYARQVIQAIGSKDPIPAFTRDNISQFSGVTEQQVELVNAQVRSFEREANGKAGNDLTVGGYVELGQLLKVLMGVARKAKQLELEGRLVPLEQVADQSAIDILSSESFSNFEVKSFGGKLRRGVTSTRTLLESFYPSAEAFATSALGRLWFSIINAEAERNLVYGRLNDKIVKAVRENVGKDTVTAKVLGPLISRIPFAPAIDRNSKPIFADELGITFSNRAEMWMAFLLMGSESGAAKFLRGGTGTGPIAGYDPETGKLDMSKWNAFQERMISQGLITKEDFDMFQVIWDVFKEIQPGVSDAMRRSDGFIMGNIQGQPIVTPWGTYTGGYVPVTVAKEFLTQERIPSLLNVDTMGYRAQDMYPNMNTGMTNERTKTYSPVSLDMSRISAYLSAATNIAYLRNPLMDFGKVIESPQVMGALEQRRKGAYRGVMVPWFEAVTKQEYTAFSDDWIQSIARKLRQNVNLAIYLGGFASALKQPLGLLPAVRQLGAHRVAYGVVRGAISPLSVRSAILAESKVMESRLTDSQERMIRSFEELSTNFDWINWTEDKVRKAQYFMIQTVQNQVDVSVYVAAKEKGLSLGMSQEEAINYANDTVNTTQSSPDVSALTNLQRGDDLKKLLTMVTSVPVAMNNLLRAETMRDQSMVYKAKALVTISLIAVVLPTLIEAISEEAFETPEEDEDDEQERQDAALQVLGMRILGGSIDTALPVVSRPFTSAAMFGAASVSPALTKLNKIPVAYQAVKNTSNGVDLTSKEFAGLMDTLTMVSGVPFSILGKGVVWNEKYFTDEDALQEFQAERAQQIEELKYEDQE